jgi:hypothetical protein
MKSKMIGAVAALGLLMLSGQSSAIEPDNTGTWAGTADYLGTLAGAFTIAGFFSISNADSLTANDVDYHLIACKTPGRKVKNIQVTFNHSDGDVDIVVKSLDGAFSQTSQGTTDVEQILLTAQSFNAVQLKVYGFQGAANPNYGIFFQCTP